MRIRPAIGLAAVVALTMTLAPSAVAAPRVSNLASNYWWQAEQSPAVLPAPPTVPAGGLWVSSGPTGPQAVSAVRFVLGADQTDPVLALQVSSAQPASAIATGIVACPTTSSWSAGPGPGSWSARPAADCAIGQVSGVVSPDGHILSFQLSKLAPTGVADIVLEPLGTPTFDATFEPITAANVSSSVTVAPVSPATTPPPTVPITAAPLPFGSLPPPVTTVTALPRTSSAPLTVTPTTPASAPSIAPAAPPTRAAAASGSFEPASSSAAQVVRIPTRSWRDRILLGLAIADIAGYMVWKRRTDLATPDGRPARVGKPPPLR